VKRILFGQFPAWGHVAPTVAIAQTLQDRGHSVAYLVHPSLRPRLEQAGLETLDGLGWGDLAARSQDHTRRRGLDLNWVVRIVRGRPAMVFLHDLPSGVFETRRALRSWRPDAVVNDTMFAPGPLAAELEGLPHATSSAAILPQWDDGLPPFGAGIAYGARKGLRWRLHEMLRRIARHRMDDVVNRARLRSGLPREPHPFMKLSPFLVMYYVTEAIEYPRPSLGRQVHYLGPSNDLRRGDQEIPFPWEWLDDRPLVLLSFGTIFVNQPAFYRHAAEASRGQAWQMVIRVGPSFDRASVTDPPKNVLFVTEQPLLRLLDRASAFISHAGVNSIVEALERGVPMVLAPAAVDQRDAAERVVRAGAGLRIDRRRADADTIRSSVRRVLDAPNIRRDAERVAADFAKCDAPTTGADLVERLAETGQPVLRPPNSPPTIYAVPENTI